MIEFDKLFYILKKNNISFFSGVPDSALKSFILLDKKKNVKNITAVNEGSAVSLGIGYNLATNKIPCIYFQNSGLTNALNPILSLADKNVYKVPLLLVIGWRGTHGKQKDEPQHFLTRKITKDILKKVGIKYIGLDKPSDLKKFDKLIKFSKKKKIISACLIKNNELVYSDKNLEHNYKKYKSVNKEIFLNLLLENINKNCRIVASTGFNSRELNEIRRKKKSTKGKDFYMVGGMGHSISLALGYHINSKYQTFCLDGDGSLLMHMGAAHTVGIFGKKNFKYILFNNFMHESVGGQKTFSENINFKNLSLSLGFKNYLMINDEKKMLKILSKYQKLKGPSFLEVIVSKRLKQKLSRPKNFLKIKKNFI